MDRLLPVIKKALGYFMLPRAAKSRKDRSLFWPSIGICLEVKRALKSFWTNCAVRNYFGNHTSGLAFFLIAHL